jgi:hypothetical protein
MNKLFGKTLLISMILTNSLCLAEESKDAVMSPEQKEMQARMQEYASPNANHEVLKSLVGNWKAHVKFWMDPKEEAQESDGTSETALIMGGRFVEQSYHGSIMGQPFEGRAIYGYDNLRKEYTGLWLDNFATGIMVSAGKYDPAAKTLTEEGSMSYPITNDAHRWYKAVTTFTDVDHYTYESYMKDKDGKEFKGMIITYTRA